jgi:hypothetical protein
MVQGTMNALPFWSRMRFPRVARRAARSVRDRLVLRRLGLSLAALMLVAGCATSPRGPQPRVEVFREGRSPDRPFSEVGMLSDSGALREQGEIEAKMLKMAGKLGADAVIFDAPVREGGELQGFSWVQTYLYRGRAIVFKP